jgi:hypothetical protein
MAARCKVYEDRLTGDIFIKHGDQRAVPVSDKPWLMVYTREMRPTVFQPGDVVLKHHYPQTSIVRVRSEDGTIEERWYII